MPTFYAVPSVESPWAGSYVEIEADTEAQARRSFDRRFGGDPYRLYPEAGWRNWQGLSVAQRGNLKRIE